MENYLTKVRGDYRYDLNMGWSPDDLITTIYDFVRTYAPIDVHGVFAEEAMQAASKHIKEHYGTEIRQGLQKIVKEFRQTESDGTEVAIELKSYPFELETKMRITITYKIDKPRFDPTASISRPVSALTTHHYYMDKTDPLDLGIDTKLSPQLMEEIAKAWDTSSYGDDQDSRITFYGRFATQGEDETVWRNSDVKACMSEWHGTCKMKITYDAADTGSVYPD